MDVGVTAAIAAVSTAIGVGLKWGHDVWRGRQKPTGFHRRLWAARRAISYALQTAHEETGALRIVLLSAHNGGGIPTATSKLRGTVIDEWPTSGDPSVLERWDGQPLDREYVRLLEDVHRDSAVAIETASMPRGILRSLYESDGVLRSVVELIGVTDEQLLYLSANFQTNEPGQHEREALRVCVNRIAKYVKGPQ